MKNIILSLFTFIISQFSLNSAMVSGLENNNVTPTQTPVATSTPSPTPPPTPKILSFDEQNKLYGPCVRLPVLMYHHIQSEKSAKENKQTALSVYTDIFSKQMEYLSQKGYSILGPDALTSFFNSGSKISTKSVVLTFDDGYEDFYTDAYPILKSLNFKATMFVPTGLVGNNGYLNWDQIMEMSQNNIYFANHTWSHKSMSAQKELVEQEISGAQKQLNERGLNLLSIFAYPYGTTSQISKDYLKNNNYNLAFTTQNGSILCKKNQLILPRVRIGNRSLNTYGF